jgi:hypothetical protein
MHTTCHPVKPLPGVENEALSCFRDSSLILIPRIKNGPDLSLRLLLEASHEPRLLPTRPLSSLHRNPVHDSELPFAAKRLTPLARGGAKRNPGFTHPRPCSTSVDRAPVVLAPQSCPRFRIAFRREAADAFSPGWSEAEPRVYHPRLCSAPVDRSATSPTPLSCHLCPPHTPPSSASIASFASKPLSPNTFLRLSKILAKTV